MALREFVTFREDLLFDGAVQVDWFEQDRSQSEFAAEHFVFHGPDYHGVRQGDLDQGSMHKLVDTASFVAEIMEGFTSVSASKPFRIAIAGYGTGKSHLALTLAHLLDAPSSSTSIKVSANIAAACKNAGERIQDIPKAQPHLVVIINGMNDFDLAGELTRQIVLRLNVHGLDAAPIEALRPRFKVAERLLDSAFFETIKTRLAEVLPKLDKASIIEGLQQHDEGVFSDVSKVLDEHDMSVSSLGRESIQELISTVCEKYCGKGKPFLGFTILFDEFGRYLEFATQRSQVAGAGAVQQLFEGVQANSELSCFVGFIQYELNAYVQRVAPEYQNEILRFVTRFQTASRYYLSVNLETLIAHFLQKGDGKKTQELLSHFEGSTEVAEKQAHISHWFPNARNHAVWSETDRFAKVVAEGCWPLHPAATWLLFHLASSGRHLQHRSALSLLRDAFSTYADIEDGWLDARVIPAIGLWSPDLENEFRRAEDLGTQIPITHSYLRIISRYGPNLDDDDRTVLRAVVLAAKLGVYADSHSDAQAAIGMLCDFDDEIVKTTVDKLINQLNVLEWDETARRFELIGDSASRPAFLVWLRQRTGMFDSRRRAELFRTRAQLWYDRLGDINPDFGSSHEVTTSEWQFCARCVDIYSLETQIIQSLEAWRVATGVDTSRGQLIYCYVPPGCAIDEFIISVQQNLRRAIRQAGARHAPLLVVLLNDKDGTLGQAMVETAILEEDLSAEQQNHFGNFPEVHRSKAMETIKAEANRLIMDRHYICGGAMDIPEGRLKPFLLSMLEEIYPDLLPFPFDGFSTTRGNAATDCIHIARQLYAGDYTRAWYTAQAPRLKNRADRVICQSWGAEAEDGRVSRRPGNQIVSSLIRSLDGQLAVKNTVDLYEFAIFVLRPPYGGNVASLMLLLGVYICPRYEQLAIEKDGNQLAPDAWLTQAIGARRSLPLEKFFGTRLTRLSSAISEEWELLLADWQNTETYLDRIQFVQQADELKQRANLPPNLFHQEKYLRDQATHAQKALVSLQKEENGARDLLKKGYIQQDVFFLALAGRNFVHLREKLIDEGAVWSDEQISELEHHIQRATQACIQFFERWLPKQTPRSTAPEDAGNFQQKLNHIRKYLLSLGLEELATALHKHTALVLRNIEKVATAHQLGIEVDNWCGETLILSPVTKMAEINGNLRTLRDLRDRVNSLKRSVELETLDVARERIQEASKHLQGLQRRHSKRFYALDRMTIATNTDIETAQLEVQALLAILEGCDSDIEDLLIMRRILTLFATDYVLLTDMTQSEESFENKLAELSSQRETQWDADDEQPWVIPVTYEAFGRTVRKLRKANAKTWVEKNVVPADTVGDLDTAEANRLLEKLRTAPPTLSVTQDKQVGILSRAVERYLNSREVDWLLERFKQLPEASKKRFLETIAQLAKRT